MEFLSELRCLSSTVCSLLLSYMHRSTGCSCTFFNLEKMSQIFQNECMSNTGWTNECSHYMFRITRWTTGFHTHTHTHLLQDSDCGLLLHWSLHPLYEQNLQLCKDVSSSCKCPWIPARLIITVLLSAWSNKKKEEHSTASACKNTDSVWVDSASCSTLSFTIKPSSWDIIIIVKTVWK